MRTLIASTVLVLAATTALLPGDRDAGAGESSWPPGQYSPTLAVDGEGNPHLAWEELLPEGHNDIYYTRSGDGGAAFEPARSVYVDPQGQARASLALDVDGNPHLVWANHLNHRYPKYIYFARSWDGGVSFTEPIRVEKAECRQDRPFIAVDPLGNPFVAWIRVVEPEIIGPPPGIDQNPLGTIHVSRSLDGGKTFEPGVCVDPASTMQGFPSMALDASGNPMVAWHDRRSGDFDIYFARSTDGGQGFLPSVTVAPHRVEQMVYGRCALAADAGGNPVIAFAALVPPKWQLYVARSKDKGLTFPVVRKLHGFDANEFYPSIALDGRNNLHVVWCADFTLYWNAIYGRFDLDGGGSILRRLDSSPFIQLRPTLDLDRNGNPHIAWHDQRGDKCLIYYTRSSDGGNSFSQPFPVW